MTVIDTTISQAEYDQLVAVTIAWRAKLDPLRAPLAKLLRSEPQRDKVIQAVKTNDKYRLLMHTYQTYQYLKQYFRDIGWRDRDG